MYQSMHLWRLLASVVVAATLVSATCVAEDGLLPVEQLPKLALAAKDAYHPIADEEVRQRKLALEKALNELEPFLEDGAPPREGGWKAYLKSDDLKKELEKATPDLRALQGIRVLFYADQEGLELPPFRSVRDALTNYMDMLATLNEPDLKKTYESRLTELATELEGLATKPTNERAISIGRKLGWLERNGYAEQLVSAVRSRYEQPNVLAQVSQRVLAAGFQQDVNQSESIRDVIMGTSVRSTANMSGQTSMAFVPDEERASFRVLLTGVAHSRNVGYKGPVVVYSRGVSRITASKLVHMNAEGVEGSGSDARVSTNSTINSISAKCKAIQRIAWKKAAQQKPAAEKIASSRAAGRLRRRFNSEATEMLEKANQDFDAKVRNPLVRRDSFPNRVRLRTSEDVMFFEMTRAGSYQLAAPSRPRQPLEACDLGVQIHASGIGNFAESLIGGETLTDERVVELFKKAKKEVPQELQIGPDKDPWSITFSRDQPVSVDFSDGRIEVAIRARKFTRGQQEVVDLIGISATYQIQRTGESIKAVRQGDVQVDYLQRKQLSISLTAMKGFMKKKFETLFKPEFVDEGLSLPERFESAGKLSLRQLTAADGWLTIAWQKPNTDEVAVVASHEVAANEE